MAAESSQQAKLVRKDFAFRSPDTLAFFEPKSFSPDLTHLVGRLDVNFKSSTLQTLDRPVRSCEAHARSGMRLTAYLGSLLSLRVRAREIFCF